MLKFRFQNHLWHFIRFFLFQFDPETTHSLACFILRGLQVFKTRKRRTRIELSGNSPQKKPLPPAPPTPSHPLTPHSPPSSHVLGLEFQSRVGLAAGFDKNAELLGALPSFGFGFAEVGTVTPRAQPGQNRPRLFRDVAHKSLLNRMGFNNQGALEVARNLENTRPFLPASFRVGVNIGKNKDTPLEEAHRDYVFSASLFKNLADYLVINVSSPNTPHLRLLQSTHFLKPLVQSVLEECARHSPSRRTPPVLLKLSPDIHPQELESILIEAKTWGLGGWVLTNTLPGSLETASGSFQGGWSGGRLTPLSQEKLKQVRSLSSLPIISVGGILNTAEAQDRIQMGADLIQIYTGWIYEGPFFPRQLSKALQKTSPSKN